MACLGTVQLGCSDTPVFFCLNDSPNNVKIFNFK